MSSAIMSAHPSQHLTSPQLLLFARGVWSLFHLWPALRLAVAEGWGGDESQAKRVWFISTVVDEFEDKAAKASKGPVNGGAAAPSPLSSATPSASSSSTPSSSSTATGVVIPPPPGLDLDALADLLYDILLEEFDIDLEDDSPLQIARQILSLWSDACQGIDANVLRLEAQESHASKTKVVASQSAAATADDDDDGAEGSGDEEGDETESEGEELARMMDGLGGEDGDAPALVERKREEPEVDEDGFTMVKKGKGGRK